MPSVCVVMASAVIRAATPRANRFAAWTRPPALPNTKVFHAGTVNAGDQIVTSGGRVLGVTAWAKDLRGRARCRLCGGGTIRFEGAQFRRDIAAKALPRG